MICVLVCVPVCDRGSDKASVLEPDRLISNGLIIVPALLLLSLKNSKLISCIIITPTASVFVRVCEGMCAHHYV